ncbi:MAG: trypsin-like peptidase domain-containing protein [Flavobacteriales bacterium]|nr:trypsin-like peptidase domain-containing protein [Flavobacteriales bacterium]
MAIEAFLSIPKRIYPPKREVGERTINLSDIEPRIERISMLSDEDFWKSLKKDNSTNIWNNLSRRKKIDFIKILNKQASKSVMILEETEGYLEIHNDKYKVKATRLKDKRIVGAEYSICESMPFSNERAFGCCSGFLIGPKLVLTVGHCIYDKVGEKWVKKTIKEISKMHVLLSYGGKPNDYEGALIDNSRVCKVKRCVDSEFDGVRDWAILELEDSIIGIEEISINTLPIKKGKQLYMLGHPLGLPLKFTHSGQVIRTSDNLYYCNLDGFGGNSGSPVFCAKTFQLVGVFSEGNEDLEANEDKECMEFAIEDKSTEEMRGESVQYLNRIKKCLEHHNHNHN